MTSVSRWRMRPTADLARGEAVGPLHGLPWAFKDLEDAVGFPNTSGSPIFKDRMPAADSALVARLRAAGVIPIGKTNVPEFGMGSHTYNRVYGTTVNPYDVTMTAGGSSGGAGAALAAGLLPLADGSDLGGSLRNPANFNNIVALRPTSGLAPALSDDTSLGLNVKGPMARSVDDVAFLLGVMTGRDVPSARARPEGRPRGLVPRSRRPAARAARAGRARREPQRLRESRMHRRRGVSRSDGRGRGVSDDAAPEGVRESGLAALVASPTDEAGSHRRDRARRGW